MNKNYKIILSVIGSLLLLCVAIELHYQNYLQSIPIEAPYIEVKEQLSINYLNGKNVMVTKEEKEISFSITNQSSEELSYYIEINRLSGAYQNATYTIKKEGNVEKQMTSLSHVSVINDVLIKPNETHRYTMNIDNSEQENFEFSLNVDLAKFDNTIGSVILKNNEVLESNNSYNNTLEMNGLIHKKEESGDIYYFKGNVLNNYVKIANTRWRIIKINEDRSVKLILDGVTENLEPINTEEMIGNTNYETTNINEKLAEWYDIQLKEEDRYIQSTIYCYDDSTLKDENGIIEYLASYRLFTDNIPTNSCSGSNISSKIALLTADEAMYIGISENNTDTFLHLDSLQSSWWTMTPSKKNVDEVFYIAIDKNGAFQKEVSEKSSLFLRPVITINPKVNIIGEGTIENPYEIHKE